MRGLYLALPVMALLLGGGTTFAATTTDTTTTGTTAGTAPAPAPTTHHRSHRSSRSATEAPAASTPSTAGQAATGTTVTPPASTTHHGTASTAGVTKYASESQAAQACGASNVVWANTSTKALHAQGDQYFGHTKHGAFMCKNSATAAGFHMSGQKG